MAPVGRVDQQLVVVERTATELWTSYAKFAGSGGNTNALWGLPGYE